MSESLLLSLIELLAISTKFRKDRERVASVITFFLKNQLDVINTDKYLSVFAAHYKTVSKNIKKGDEYLPTDSSRTVIICSQLNKELTQQQKINILFMLFSAVENGRSVSEIELQFLKTMSEVFYINDEDFYTAFSFSILGLENDLSAKGSLIAYTEFSSELQKEKLVKMPELEGTIGVLKMDSAGLHYVKYSGDQYVMLNDAKMMKNAIYSFGYGDIIRLENTDPLHFSDLIAKLSADQGKILFEADRITYQFANGKIGIHELSFSETSGRLVGLMGSSGAGKSTLLEVLNGNRNPKSGHVWINNVDVHNEKEKIEGIVGYVPQDDLLIEDLTVFQNLYFAAKLSFKDMTEVEATDLARKVIADLGLTEATHLKVGNALQKSLSGGQRKRLNIGLELLRAPSVLFLDEPTSGLSSKDSQNIMELLKDLSLAGKLIFVVIHQPSPDIFKLFDRLLIMDTGGYPIYYGNPLDAITYFKGKANRLNKDQVYDRGRLNPEIIFDLIESKTLTEYGQYTTERRTSPAEWYYEFRKKIIPGKKMFDGERLQAIKSARWARQLKVFFLRDTLSKLNNVQYLIINAIQAPVLAFLLAIVNRFYDISVDSNSYFFSANTNMPVFLFISIIVSLFLGLTVSAEEIVQDRKILKRERFLNLSRSSYLSSKMIILFSLSAFQTLLYWLVSCYVLGIKDFMFIHYMLLFSTSVFANMLGLNISSMFNRAITVYILIPVILIPQLVLGGIVLRFDKINPDVKERTGVPVMSEMMASRWAYEGLMISFYKDNDYNKHFYDLHKEKMNNEIQLMYKIPAIEARLNYAIEYYGTRDFKKLQKIIKDLDLVRNELIDLSKESGIPFSQMENVKLDGGKYPLTVALEYVKTLRDHYSKTSNKIGEKERLKYEALRVVYQNYKALDSIRKSSHNETIERYVRGTDEDEKIVEFGGRLHTLAEPVYRDPTGSRLFSRTHFFSPYKYLLGMKVSTPIFNIIVLWIMSALLYVSLYYNSMRFLFRMFNRKYIAFMESKGWIKR